MEPVQAMVMTRPVMMTETMMIMESAVPRRVLVLARMVAGPVGTYFEDFN
jgi:hypothetical protein